MIYILHSENFYIFSKMQNATLNILKAVAKTCEKALRLTIKSSYKSESRKKSFTVEKSY